jgi:3-hydroxyisobutyrate dehydrogenase
MTRGQRKTVGFVGLGHVGRPMAANLVGVGYDVVVHDADRERAVLFAADHGCTHAETPLALADAEAIVTMLPNGEVVRDVLLRSGLGERLPAGTLAIDTSSSDPLGTQELGAELSRRGVHLVDVGVSMPEGGRAAERMITFMVGADDDDAFARAAVLLEAMGNRIVRVGPLGAGHAMKTLNNYVGAAGLAAALDALVVGCRYGLDPVTMLGVLNFSTGRNFSTEFPLRERAVTRRFDSGYALSLLLKDLRIAAKVAERAGFDPDLLALLESEFGAAAEALEGDPDHLVSLEHWEQRAGVRLPTASGRT